MWEHANRSGVWTKADGPRPHRQGRERGGGVPWYFFEMNVCLVWRKWCGCDVSAVECSFLLLSCERRKKVFSQHISGQLRKPQLPHGFFQYGLKVNHCSTTQQQLIYIAVKGLKLRQQIWIDCPEWEADELLHSVSVRQVTSVSQNALVFLFILPINLGLSIALLITLLFAASHALSLSCLQDPILSTISPHRGPKAGGSSLTITGQRLRTGHPNEVSVLIGGIPCDV